MTSDVSPLIQATAFLRSVDADWAALIDSVGPCTLECAVEREPYEALIRAVAHQQLHGRAAEAILARLLARFTPPDAAAAAFPGAEKIMRLDEAELRACGFSGAKIAALRDIAGKTLEGLVPSAAEAREMTDTELIERLTQVRGVGRWTVEMVLIFTLGRLDVLPVDDFGVREGWRVLKQLPEQPKPRALAEAGRAWAPFRSVAAWYLWRAADLGKQSR